jgi:two-component system sensor histidine kinase BaeS
VSRGRVPLHRSLVGRLLATSVLIAVAAIVATAWLATQSTTRAIRQEQGRSLADDKSVYDMLVGYAATHRDWSDVGTVIVPRAAKLGRRITLTTEERDIIADSRPGPSLRAARPSATVDPLRLDLGLTGGTDRIDPRAVGPYRLPSDERALVRRMLDAQLKCMADGQVDGKIVDSPGGRPTVEAVTLDPKNITAFCGDRVGDITTKTEERALRELAKLTARCLDVDAEEVYISRQFRVFPLRVGQPSPAADTAQIRSCLQQARVRQLRPYVAPPALLFVTDPSDSADTPVFTLSRANAFRIAWVTGTVLLAAVLVTILMGRRLVRPLRALTDAAAQPVDDRSPMPVAGDDEIGYLARALNDLAERRERAEAQRRAMVSDVAHELRTPLTNIRSWLEAAQDGLTPPGPSLLDLLHEEALLLQHIIDDLSDLAAADAGNLRVHPEAVYAGDLVTQVGEAHRSAAAKARVTLSVRVDGDPEVQADPVRLRQMVGNLVSNAIRYTPPGGSVTVTATADPQGLTVAVADTGVGIAPEDLPRIFDRFWRADSSRTRATGGSGLGLPIARKLAEAHGGTITAVSRPGAGTTMTVWLPAAPVRSPAASPA